MVHAYIHFSGWSNSSSQSKNAHKLLVDVKVCLNGVWSLPGATVCPGWLLAVLPLNSQWDWRLMELLTETDFRLFCCPLVVDQLSF